MKRKDLSSLIGFATNGVAATITDTLLFCFFLYGSSFGKQGSRGVYQAFEEAGAELEQINYQSIKGALYQLRHKDLIARTKKRSSIEISITQAGKKRLASLFPVYQTSRPWDGHVYLISYDIPRDHNHFRNLLRSYIRKTGAALLQESLWLHPYNPQQLIQDFAETHHIPGMILVSKLDPHGTLGDEDLEALLVRIYKLDELQSRYQTFLGTYPETVQPNPISLAIAYFSVLKDDPQLPFELQPKGFAAEKSYNRFLQLSQQMY